MLDLTTLRALNEERVAQLSQTPSLYERILAVLGAHESLAMDAPADRVTLARALLQTSFKEPNMNDITKTEKWQKEARSIKAGNRRFAKLTRKQQRVAIAQDVIKLLKSKKIVAASTYFSAPYKFHNLIGIHPDLGDVDLATALSVCSSRGDPCTVCGIGSLFVAAITKADQYTVSDSNRGGVHRYMEIDYLSRWFDSDQLTLIEHHYEQIVGGGVGSDLDNNKRMIAIMENIISNGGKFNPYKGKNAVDRLKSNQVQNLVVDFDL